jgi:hypothetical protein
MMDARGAINGRVWLRLVDSIGVSTSVWLRFIELARRRLGFDWSILPGLGLASFGAFSSVVTQVIGFVRRILIGGHSGDWVRSAHFRRRSLR